MWPFLAVLSWPLIEIALFVTLGGAIGLLGTLAWVLASAAIGVALLRAEGRRNGGRVAFDPRRIDPLSPLANRVLIALAAMFLILPGFLTDALGLLLLLPPIRALVIGALARRIRLHPRAPMPDDGIVEAEWEDVTPGRSGAEDGQLRPPSGWTRH